MSDKYCSILTIRILAAFQRITMTVGNNAGVSTTSFWTPEVVMSVFVKSRRAAETAASALITSVFWERKVSNGYHPNDETHIEDPKNLIQVQFPGRDPLFIFPRVEIPRDHVPFGPLSELHLNVCHGPGIESIINDSSRPMSMAQLTPRIDLSRHTRAN